MHFAPTAAPEDQARAQLYGLVASLFYAAPDAQLLSALVHAEGFRDDEDARTEQGRALAAAWRELTDACRNAFPVLLVRTVPQAPLVPSLANSRRLLLMTRIILSTGYPLQ